MKQPARCCDWRNHGNLWRRGSSGVAFRVLSRFVVMATGLEMQRRGRCNAVVDFPLGRWRFAFGATIRPRGGERSASRPFGRPFRTRRPRMVGILGRLGHLPLTTMHFGVPRRVLWLRASYQPERRPDLLTRRGCFLPRRANEMKGLRDLFYHPLDADEFAAWKGRAGRGHFCVPQRAFAFITCTMLGGCLPAIWKGQRKRDWPIICYNSLLEGIFFHFPVLSMLLCFFQVQSGLATWKENSLLVNALVFS